VKGEGWECPLTATSLILTTKIEMRMAVRQFRLMKKMVLEYSNFENDIDFETDLGAGQYLMDDTSNLNADHGSDILDTQWDCYSAQDMLIPTVGTTTEQGSSSRGLQFDDEVPLPSFPV
jgi:hypothetical protein